YVTANGIRLPVKPDTSADESMGKQQASAAPLGLRPRPDPVQQSSRDLLAPDIAEPEAAEAALPLPHQQPNDRQQLNDRQQQGQQEQQQQQQGQGQEPQGRAAAGRHMPPPLDTRSPARQQRATAGQAAAPPSTAARPELEGDNPALFPHSLRAGQQHAALPFQFFATCHPGLEQYVVEELESLGLSEVVPGKAGVSFRSASLSGGYRAALWLRCAIRVLVKLGEGRLDTFGLGGRNGAELLYDLVRDCGVRWQEVIRPGGYHPTPPHPTPPHPTPPHPTPPHPTPPHPTPPHPTPPHPTPPHPTPPHPTPPHPTPPHPTPPHPTPPHPTPPHPTPPHPTPPHPTPPHPTPPHPTPPHPTPPHPTPPWPCPATAPGDDPAGCSFEVAVRLRSCSDLNSSHLVWQRVKDAVCDAVYDARRERPQPPGVNGPDVPLFVAAYQDQVTLYRDLCGTSLHRRGYRDAMHRAPLNEAAAAGMLMMAGWHRLSQQGAVLADPMCGSGTLLLEAGLMASRRAPGLARPSGSWPFTRWHDFDSQGWRQAKEEAQDLVQPWGGRLYGNDTQQAALGLARRDLGRAGLLTQCRLHQGDAASWTLPQAPDLVVTNPPWGLRLGSQRSDDDQDDAEERAGPRGLLPDLEPGDEGQLESSWRSLATFLRAQCPDATALVLSGNKNAFNYLRMKTFRKWPLTVGGVEARVHAYHVLPPKSASHAAESSAEGAVAITI
ncbi:hypothetical protein QJQ45_022969, partial [Haematococcus lacustris]